MHARPLFSLRFKKLWNLSSRSPASETLCTKEEQMRMYKIAAMGGDGIGPEVVEAGVQVLKVCAERDGGFTLDFQDFDLGFGILPNAWRDDAGRWRRPA